MPYTFCPIRNYGAGNRPIMDQNPISVCCCLYLNFLISRTRQSRVGRQADSSTVRKSRWAGEMATSIYMIRDYTDHWIGVAQNSVRRSNSLQALKCGERHHMDSRRATPTTTVIVMAGLCMETDLLSTCGCEGRILQTGQLLFATCHAK